MKWLRALVRLFTPRESVNLSELDRMRAETWRNTQAVDSKEREALKSLEKEQTKP